MRARPIGRGGRFALLSAAAAAWTAVLRRPVSPRPVDDWGYDEDAPYEPPEYEEAAPRRLSWAGIMKKSVADWFAGDVSRRAAALSYYTIFSMAPLVLIVVAVVGTFFGDQAAQKIVEGQFRGFLGEDQAGVVLDMIRARQRQPASGVGATIFGSLLLVIGATAVVGELQSSLDQLWGLPERKGGILGNIKSRLLSLAFILSLGFLLLVSLVLSAAVSATGAYLQGILPAPEAVLQALNHLLSLGVITVMFGLMYRYLPNSRIAWRKALVGGLATALLFTVGNFLLGIYLGKAGPTSVYGAAGSVLAVFLWAYYCAHILYLGAQVTRTYAEARP